MSIDDGFKKILDGMRQADEGRDEIMAWLDEAWHGRKDLDGQIHTLESTIGDLKESVTELQRLIMEQGTTLRALRERLDEANGG